MQSLRWKCPKGIRVSQNGLVAAVLIMFIASMLFPGAALGQSLTFVVDGNINDAQAWQTIAENYEQKTGVEVNLLLIPFGEYDEKLSVMIASGIAPDILFYSARFIARLAANDAFENHWNYADKMLGVGDIFPAGFDEVTLDDKLYGVPSDLNSSILAFNADMFAEAGLVSPADQWRNGQWTWAEYLESARLLTRDIDGDGRPDQFGTGGFATWAGNWPIWFWANGADLLNPDKRIVAVNSPAGIEALQFASDLNHVYQVVGGRWQDGTSAMWISGLNALHSIRNTIGDSFDLAPFPTGPSGQGPAATYFGGGYSIFKNAPNKDEAYRFLDYLVSEEVEELRIELASRLPIRRDGIIRYADRQQELYGSPASLDLIVDILDSARPLPITPVWDEMERIWWEEVRPVTDGRQPANYGLERFEQRVNSFIGSW